MRGDAVARPENATHFRPLGASRRGGGNPWRAENPTRGSAPIVRGNTRRPEYGLPIRAETPGGALETGRVLACDFVTALSRESGTRRRVATRTTERARTLAIKSGALETSPHARWSTTKARRGKGCREMSRRSEGKPSEGRTPGVPPVRNRTGRVMGGRRRQAAEEAGRRSTAGPGKPGAGRSPPPHAL
jgi:hypothetical protein